MHATLKRLQQAPHALADSGVVRRHLRAPARPGRVAEGGLRLAGRYKQPAAQGADAPLVSVITVCLNAARTLRQCARSVLAQTHDNVEYLVIDGGSVDGTLDVVAEHAHAIDYYVSEPDAGLYQAMNKGLALAAGDYVLVLNADDWYAPDCIEALLAAKRASGASFVSALAQYVDAGGRPLVGARRLPYDAGAYLRMPLRHETMLLSPELYNRVGHYDESYRILADRKLTARLFAEGCSLHEVPRALLFFRQRGLSNANLPALFAERARLMREQFPFLSEEEARLFADLDRLAPRRLAALAQKHAAHAGFARAVEAYCADAPAEPGAPGRRLSVATFCSIDQGGAGTGSRRRVAALREHGIDARMFSLVAKSGERQVRRLVPELPGVDTSRQRNVWHEVAARAIVKAARVPGRPAAEMFSLTDSVLDFGKLGAVFESHDVVHLHWVVGMLDYANLGKTLGDKPVVWTLADMNAFTGGCHYSEGCQEYKRECRRCPFLGEDSDLAHRTWKIKQRAYAGLKNLHIVCPSPWMAERARESSLLRGRPIHTIPNPFPLERFRPTPKVLARMQLGLPLRKKLLLFGAETLSNRRKGGDLLRDALGRFAAGRAADQLEVLVFGHSSVEFPLPVRELGYVSEDEKLALVYSAADGYLLPSREDNAPLTVVEAMACGTPVVAFPVGNVPDLVEHGVSGYLARHLDVEDFARGLEWLVDAPAGERFARGARCRMRAAALHEPTLAASRHEAVYRAAMKSRA